jgi:hypothetical protein
MKPKNYELLGHRWEYYLTLDEFLEDLSKNDAKKASLPIWRSRSSRIEQKVFYPVLQHLGFGPIAIEAVRKEIEHGVDLAVDYFDDTWWRPDEMRRAGLSENELDVMNARNLRAMDKSRSDRELKWYEAFKNALFLGGLAGRWDDLARISSWFDATIEPEYQAGQLEDEYQQLFICIAGSLSPQPMEGMDELLAKVKKCRTKRPRLLCAAWEAAHAADQAAFNKAFPETVKHFLSKPEDGQVYDWVAIDQSSIWFIAEHRGLTLPPLSERQAAAVVTRQSAGLAG